MEVGNIVFRKSLIYGGQALSSSLVLQMSNKEDFKDFEAMTEKSGLFHPINLSLSRVNKKLFQGSLQRLYFDKRTTAAPQEDPHKMVGILHYNTHIKTLSNLNTTCNCLVLYLSINPYLFGNQKVFFLHSHIQQSCSLTDNL